MKLWTTVATALAAAVLSGSPRAEPPAGEAPGDLIPSLLAAHNRERAEAKLPPLTLDPKLNAAAQAHADDMAAHRKMAHEGSDGSSPSDRIKRQGYAFQNDGENVAMGWPTVDEVMKGWMNSPHHRENILGKYSQVGLAVARDKDGKPYWAADFATPWPTLDPDRAAADLVAAVNKERASAGKPRLSADPKLNKLAARIVADLARADDLQPPEGRGDLLSGLKQVGYRYRKVAESAASGQPEARDVVTTWTDSPSHKENLLGDFTDAGAGYATAKSGKPYWCLILARPLR